MRILIDLQGCQSEGNKTRGIGRYTRELIKNILKSKETEEIVLLANGRLNNIAHIMYANTDQNVKNIYYCEWIGSSDISYNLEKNTYKVNA